ncbi:hypothetical protein WJX73_004235 [Symbiochloris irregularis]|uniref:Uncharacterized protein n=1 Tax=Symbiochloris irregularis TaxID=706552 RepID=A0AAW1PUT1_9CHLO
MPADQKATWYAVIANSDFMLHDVQNESFAEQLRERRRMFGETSKDINFFLVPEPAWLDSKFPNEGKRVGRPSLAVVSPDKQWITFMKLRLDRVLRLELGEMTREEVTKSVGKVPEYGPLDKSKWTAPYSPYRPGWWEMFIVKDQH